MEPPNPGAIDMRHMKLKASEAALLAGELVKPTWASRNEGIHERVSFEDTLWGFEMAGGAYYKTPLRVAYVRPGSRAERACIRMGDTVLRINGQDTSNLTLQEAHKLVLEAGINLKIVVTSPDDKENAHYDYEDPLIDHSGPTDEQLKEMERERVRRALERAARCRDLPWPWVRRKWVIYRESNCYMVPSKYEAKHKDKFPELPAERLVDNYYPVDKKNSLKNKSKEENKKPIQENGIDVPTEEEGYEEVEEEVEDEEEVVTESEKIEDNQVENNGDERLEHNIDEKQSIQQENFNEEDNHVENTEYENTDSIKEKIDDSNLESEINKEENSAEIPSENPQQNSINSTDNVIEHKNEEASALSQNNENDLDEKIINEIVQNMTELEEKTSSDDDILNSVLNDSSNVDLQTER